MSQLQTHDLKDICAIEAGKDESPGNLVRHVEDERSFGTVVAYDPRKQGFENQPQVTVLWAKEPIIVQVQSVPINAQSRVLRAKWQVEEQDDMRVYGSISTPKFSMSVPRLKGEEEYNSHELSPEEMEQLRQDADNVTFHQDGRIVVERRADQPPDYLREPDGSFRSSYRRR